MATALYCDIDDVQNRLSADGLNLRSDDNPPDDYGDILDDASRTIDEYCLLTYSDGNLLDSPWVKHRTADIAAFLACERRGNPVPVGIGQKYERALEKLARVLKGSLIIPDIAQRKTAVPAMSNVRVRLDPFPRTVVERHRSSKAQAEGYRQHVDRTEIFDYCI